jgi:hypothetical protein
MADVVDDPLCDVARNGVRSWCGFFAGFAGEKEVIEIGILLGPFFYGNG